MARRLVSTSLEACSIAVKRLAKGIEARPPKIVPKAAAELIFTAYSILVANGSNG